MKRTRKVKRHPRRSYRRHMNSMNGGVKKHYTQGRKRRTQGRKRSIQSTKKGR